MTITPDQAQALLHGTTPGPWGRTVMGALTDTDGKVLVNGPDWNMDDSDADLASVAPDMAETIAGMQWEYIFQEKVPISGQWKRILSTTTWPLDHCQDVLARMQSELPEKEYRLIRRLVGKPEVID